ncbi:MAG: nitrilase-related carbon-nitrogen hydrolase [Planctomycetia bacterium]
MARCLTIAAAQSGPVTRHESRRDVVERRIAQLRQAAAQAADLVVFPEVALTAFFPHWWIADERELDAWFEREMPGPDVEPLFAEARRLGLAFTLGYAELVEQGGRKRRFNTSVLVDKTGEIVGKYRKLHLPGHDDHRPHNPFQNLEQRYFEVGDLPLAAWPLGDARIGMCICNDRRWPETYRVLALAGAEVIVLGYNTPDHIPEHPGMDRLVPFHNRLCMQAGAHQNGAWVVGVAKGGVEEGVSQIGDSVIVAPSGEVVATAATLGDEVIVHRCDLDLVTEYRTLFNFARNRRPDCYGPITRPHPPVGG